VFFSGMLNLLAFGAGRQIRGFCRKAAQMQFDGLNVAYVRQRDLIHDEVSNAVRSIKDLARRGDHASIVDRLHDLQVVIRNEQHELDVATEEVNVLMIIRRALSVLPADEISSDVPAGPAEVPQSVGEFIGKATSQLAGNIANHRVGPGSVKFRIERQTAILVVRDSGTGFDSHVLDDPANTIHRLREQARELGGELLVRSRSPHEIVLYVPLFQPR
jgi:hypothetical protein